MYFQGERNFYKRKINFAKDLKRKLLKSSCFDLTAIKKER